jgi:peptidyl-prolyl cis-trans isomerase A (cyclophilin A)
MQYQRVFAEFETSKGTFKGELFPLVAPKAVANFIGLATGTKKFIDAKNGQEVQRPFYKDQIFHRVVSNFLIQGGCPLGNGTGWPGYRFEDEFHPLYRHAKPGVMGMANAAPNQNGSQFYITLNAAPDLDNKHTIFGQVISGMNVVKAIGEVQTDINDRPVEKVELKNVKIIYQ